VRLNSDATDVDDSRGRSSLIADPFRAEHRQFPGIRLLIVAHEIRIAVGASQFEVPIVGRQPRVDHLRDDDAAVSKNQRTRRLLAAVAGVALDAHAEEPRFRHEIIIRPETLLPHPTTGP